MDSEPLSRTELLEEAARLRTRLAEVETDAARGSRGHLALLEAVAAGNRPLAEVLAHLARLVEAERPGMLCSILLYDPVERCLRHGAAPSLPESYNAQADGLPIGPTMGSCGTAAYRRERVVVEEIASDPLWAPFKEVASAHDLHACWSQPILGTDGELLGTLAMYYREPRRPTPTEVDLIETAAHVVALAIERHRTENALRTSEHRYRALIQGANDAIFIADMESGLIVEVNPRAADLLGRPADEIVGMHQSELHPADTRERYRASFKAHGRAGQAVHTDAEVVRADGRRVPVEISANAIEIDGRRLLQGIFRDMTPHVEAAQALRRLNRALLAYSGCNRALIRATDETSFLTEMCRVIVEEAGYRMAWVGLARDDARRTVEPVAQAGAEDGYLAEIDITWGDEPHGLGPTGTAIRTCTPQVAQDLRHDPAYAPWRDAATARGYASSVALPFDGEADHALGVLNVYAAEPHAFDEAEVALLTELADDVAHGIRTLRGRMERLQLEEERDGLERQLRQAQKMEAIGTLAGGIAHDFNNILQAIVGYADLGRDSLADDHPTRAYLDHILLGARRASDLVNQILTFSRQTESHRRPCTLQPVIKEALKLLAATLPATIEVRAEIDATCPKAIADPTQVHQVVMNLATNAFHAMRGAGGILEVSLAAHHETGGEDPPQWIRLTVRDTGCGMDAATRERIFDPFFTTKGVGEGTGLGLAVVHGIIADHGGRIEVESESDRGTTIHVDLPSAAEAADEPPSASTCSRGRGERIAVVDDDTDVAAILGEILQKLGYRPTLFTDPRLALAAIDADPAAIDLVITDQVMPTMSGTALAAAVADLRPDLPIILLTGYADEGEAEGDVVRCRLTKPISAPELARTLHRLLHPAHHR